ncbi:MAG TPA: hypothetical protein EYQ73_01980 [Candidatus Poseidoniales archaeon]|jgi:hypothetical protein|nr:MAG: hypothetical protein CXT71_06635 [Euryarchaeota archaeon]HIF45548.1 hypothetical protein [Candidatus Poseidoniales archaeon]HIL65140.1 hypothetical protein [Candidatus Poseidoniales archaeon]
MTNSASIDEFIRHMQAELDDCEQISDKQEREQRQWQLEVAIQEAILFNNRFKQLEKIGSDPLQIVQALAMPDAPSAENPKSGLSSDSNSCKSCGGLIEAELGFCASCGKYSE